MMEFIIDKGGGPVIKLSRTGCISILPVTKYQFERYIWQASPLWCDYQNFLKETGRISPSAITVDNFSSAFLTNIDFEGALEFSKWFGARLPTIQEWNEAYEIAFKENRLFQETLKYMGEIRMKQKIDIRIYKLMERLCKVGIKRRDLNSEIGELACEFPAEPYGRIYLKYNNEGQALVTGSPSRKTREHNFGFSWVVVE